MIQMNKENLENSHNNIQSFSQVQNQSARLNIQRQVEPSILQKLKAFLQRKLSKKNIVKGLFLFIVIISTLFIAGNFLEEMLVNQKTPPTISYQFFNQVNEVSAPSQVAYRAFYYYKKMVQMAKYNMKVKKTYQSGNNQFKNLTFWQLYSIFKVVKTIQLAKGYSSFSEDDGQTEQQTEDYSNIQNLTTPVSYRQFFNPAADQGRCASCYSFPITATIQYVYARKFNNLIKLSQQQLIDCSNPDEKANGCNDGNITRGFQYAQHVGLVQEKDYHYRSQGGSSFPCNKNLISNQSITKFKISSFKQLPPGDCRAIQAELAKGNVVASMMNAQKLGQMSDFKQSFRDCRRDRPNHAITIVGQTDKQEWIVRNSWGQGWGDHGYFKIGKGNTCGVCNYAIVPILDQKDHAKDDN